MKELSVTHPVRFFVSFNKRACGRVSLSDPQNIYSRLIQQQILRDTELAAKKGFQKSTRLEKGAVFSATGTESE